MKKRIFVLNGIHGSGKTTLGELFAQNDPRLVFYPEIGRQLRNEVTYNSLESGEAFDLEVMRRELERDEILLSTVTTPVVETWHIGNIGYVAARSPHLLEQYSNVLIRQLQRFEPIGVYINIDWDTFRSRASEKIAPDQMEDLVSFYKVISEKTLVLYKDLGIQTLTIENQSTLEHAFAALKEGVSQLGEGARAKGKEQL